MNPIINQIGTVFIPVKEIEKARDWYCDILGLPVTEEILFDHLYVLPMQGTGVVLDSKIYHPERIYQSPPFHFNTSDIEEAYQFMKDKGVKVVTKTEHDQWFNIKDLDGNVLMICEC
ncbi:VOC family protein [Virgibacillus necropolis]|uniref:Glyoxalase n=1 Tax=Virgibacillus necropolis TaxID=163877 RepID=A0A221MHX2_9BACI|nr:VOC family protein [Virgibacillus necropolis]ASN07230.1 glyoxalase [Virgibacillus necropolis]